MSKGNWNDRISLLTSDAKKEVNENPVGGLNQPERHLEILRKKILLSLFGASLNALNLGTKAHKQLDAEVNFAMDAIVSNSQKDGLDLDGELLNFLSDVSAKLFAIEQTWNSINNMMDQHKGN